MRVRTGWFAVALGAVVAACAPVEAQSPLKIFISVDMEGIGGVGAPSMTSTGGKDYGTARELMTGELNAVTAAIYARNPDAEILVNDSHGDHQNALHTRLDPRVTYIQGSIKPLGMVQGLDATFDGAIFIGYHAKAGDPDGFLAHTGSGSVKGLWLNDVEVGEGGMNAAFAGSVGVPVILAAGDSAATAGSRSRRWCREPFTRDRIAPHRATPHRVLRRAPPAGLLRHDRHHRVRGPERPGRHGRALPR